MKKALLASTAELSVDLTSSQIRGQRCKHFIILCLKIGPQLRLRPQLSDTAV